MIARLLTLRGQPVADYRLDRGTHTEMPQVIRRGAGELYLLDSARPADDDVAVYWRATVYDPAPGERLPGPPGKRPARARPKR